MSNEASLVKANYCRSIMRTAAIGSDDESRFLIKSLTTELQTRNTAPEVAEAERIAHSIIRDLAELLAGRRSTAGSMEWTRAGRAVEKWIAEASLRAKISYHQ